MRANWLSALFGAAIAILLLAGFGILRYQGDARAQATGPLAISMSHAPEPVASGGTVDYTITVTNTGITEQSGVVVEDVLSGPGSILSAAPSQGSCAPPDPTTVSCDLGNLASAAVATITVHKVSTLGGVGGIVELPDIAQGGAAVGASGNSGLSPGGIAAIAGGMAAALLAVGTGGWYVRRRWLRHE